MRQRKQSQEICPDLMWYETGLQKSPFLFGIRFLKQDAATFPHEEEEIYAKSTQEQSCLLSCLCNTFCTDICPLIFSGSSVCP